MIRHLTQEKIWPKPKWSLILKWFQSKPLTCSRNMAPCGGKLFAYSETCLNLTIYILNRKSVYTKYLHMLPFINNLCAKHQSFVSLKLRLGFPNTGLNQRSP